MLDALAGRLLGSSNASQALENTGKPGTKHMEKDPFMFVIKKPFPRDDQRSVVRSNQGV